MNKFKSITNLKWANQDKTIIDAAVEILGHPTPNLPYSFLDDSEHHDIFLKLVGGEFGIIADYTEPPLPTYQPPVFESLTEGIQYKTSEIKQYRTRKIAVIRGTSVDNLNNYEAKLARLSAVAQEMRINPQLFSGEMFNGTQLPSTETAIISVANDFISEQMKASSLIEAVIFETDELLNQVMNAKTVDELQLIVC